MPERIVKRRLQDCDTALASDDGPIFSTAAKLVNALDPRSRTASTSRRSEKRCVWGVSFCAGSSTR
jgi:hypothetical protein